MFKLHLYFSNSKKYLINLFNLKITNFLSSQICQIWEGTFLVILEKFYLVEVKACNSVDLESVFPTHGVVGSNPTKPIEIQFKKIFLSRFFLECLFK